MRYTARVGKRPSSRRWLQEHRADPYVQQARAEGYRSRAAFKLQQLDHRYGLLQPGSVVVDLGASPGGWSQWSVQRVGPKGKVYALDVLPLQGIPGVTFVQGDFREEAVRRSLLDAVGERGVDLLLSDMAPNLSGVAAIDQARAIELGGLALDLAVMCLRRGGAMLVKVFQGEGLEDYLREVRRHFRSLGRSKPESSRARSRELYVLARGFGGV